jgi:hypothetical protein
MTINFPRIFQEFYIFSSKTKKIFVSDEKKTRSSQTNTTNTAPKMTNTAPKMTNTAPKTELICSIDLQEPGNEKAIIIRKRKPEQDHKENKPLQASKKPRQASKKPRQASKKPRQASKKPLQASKKPSLQVDSDKLVETAFNNLREQEQENRLILLQLRLTIDYLRREDSLRQPDPTRFPMHGGVNILKFKTDGLAWKNAVGFVEWPNVTKRTPGRVQKLLNVLSTVEQQLNSS